MDLGDGGDVALWALTARFGGLDAASPLLFPQAYGLVYSNVTAAGIVPGGCKSELYPSGGRASMQFLALGGAYVAAQDPLGAYKEVRAWASKDGASAALGFELLAEDAGVPAARGTLYRYTLPYALAIGATGWAAAQPEDAPSASFWYLAARVYRAWALKHAVWTRKGLLSNRTADSSDVPQWLADSPLWFNTGWSFYDVFQPLEGDPSTVVERMSSITRRFSGAGSIALHWYEWQQGKAPDGARYRFDTHYPDYFPARGGFADAVAKVQAMGAKVVPYINGRLFDVRSDSWRRDGGAEVAALKPAADAQLLPGGPSNASAWALNYTIETYGSEAVDPADASFAPACPYTEYWQAKYANISAALVETAGVAGIYIDQVGAGAPVPCFNPSHGHPLGGGSHWMHGARALMDRSRQRSGVPCVTEANAEPVLDQASGMLILDAFEQGAAALGFNDGVAEAAGAGIAADTFVVNAYGAVYGGMFVPFGQTYSRDDFAMASVLPARIGSAFVMGAQLGWFSLGGNHTAVRWPAQINLPHMTTTNEF